MRVDGREADDDGLAALVDAARGAGAEEREELLDDLERAYLCGVEVGQVVLREGEVFEGSESG